MAEITVVERRRRLAAAKEGLKGADSRLGAEAWQWGNHLKDIYDHELWREDEATSWSAWCVAHLTMSRRQADRALALCRHFTLEMATRFGSRRLSAALNYIELTGKIEQPGDILALEIRFRDEKGRFTSVPFGRASVQQIEDACAALREAASARAEKERLAAIDAEVRARVEALARALPEARRGRSAASGCR